MQDRIVVKSRAHGQKQHVLSGKIRFLAAPKLKKNILHIKSELSRLFSEHLDFLKCIEESFFFDGIKTKLDRRFWKKSFAL